MDLNFNSFSTSVGTILEFVFGAKIGSKREPTIEPKMGLTWDQAWLRLDRAGGGPAECGRPVETWKVDLGKELIDLE